MILIRGKSFQVFYIFTISLFSSFYTPLFCQTYYVHPSGSDAYNGLYKTYQGGLNGPWATITMANSSLSAGDTVELFAGTYNDQIRPVNSGTSNNDRIVYRPAGNGPVVLPICFYGDGTYESRGSIALGRRNYITVTGRSAGGDEDERLIQIIATGLCDLYGNAAGSEGCVIENIIMQHDGPTYAPNRGFVFSDYWWEGQYETKYCILRNCIIEGYIRNVNNPTQYTEDIISVAKNAHHLIVEDNFVGTCRHVSLNFQEATTRKMIIRNNEIINPQHTALSFYGLGANPTIQHSHLIEENTMKATAYTANLQGNPGNALQFGASETIVRHNIIAEGGYENANSTVGGMSCNLGGTPGQVLDMSDNRFYNNTIVNNKGICSGSFFFGGDGYDKGRNKWVNNVIYGSTTTLVLYWTGFDDGYDRYISNIFGNVAGSPSENIINVGLGPVNLATAISTYSNPIEPDFTNWNGFDNLYDANPPFQSYGSDYAMLPGGSTEDTGAPLTVVSASDALSGTTLTVEDSRMFYGEFSEFPLWMNVQADQLAIGPAYGTAQVVDIVDITDSLNQITLADPITRNVGDFVWLHKNSRGTPKVLGAAPDIGASEHGQSSSTAEIILEQSGITLFPNLVQDFVTLQLIAGNYEVKILDASGALYENVTVTDTYTIDLTILPAGLYFIEIVETANNLQYLRKILKQ